MTFRHTYRFVDGDERTSESTLRFRTRDEVGATPASAGFRLADVRDAPDRPGLERVLIAQRS